MRGPASDEVPQTPSCDGDLYEENYDATRFMLCKLEEAHRAPGNTTRSLGTRQQRRVHPHESSTSFQRPRTLARGGSPC